MISNNLKDKGKKMFSHVMIGANDLEASRQFYDAVLGALNIPAGS